MHENSPSISIAISYCRKDEDGVMGDGKGLHGLKNLHSRVLDPLKSEFNFECWQDENIEAGSRWDDEILRRFASADLVIALIGPCYLGSKYAFVGDAAAGRKSEFDIALDRERHNEADLVSVIVGQCDALDNPKIRLLQVVPAGGRWAHDDATWMEVKKQLRKVLSRIRDRLALRADDRDGEGSPPLQAEPDLTHYLNWVKEECGWIGSELAGAHSGLPEDFWRIEKRYVNLHVQTTYGQASGGRQEVLAALRANRLLAILGEPGEGKTTAFRHAAYFYAQYAEENDANVVPVLLKASTIVAFLEGKTEDPGVGDLFEVWNNEVRRCGWSLPLDWLNQMLACGRALVMIDALDDVPKKPRRLLLKLVRLCAIRWPTSRWCVLLRKFAWLSAELPGFRVAEMCDLDDAAVRDYIESWERDIRALSPTSGAPHASARDLLRAIGETPALQELSRRPLFLTAICIIYWCKGELPTTRASLFKLIMEWLIRSRRSDSENFSSDARFDAYSLVAFAMCDLSAERREDIYELARCLAEAEVGFPRLNRETARRFLETEASTLGLLKMERGICTFSHRPFQEYFAARRLTMLEDEWVEVMRRRIHDDSWAEMFALFAAMLIADGRRATAGRLVKVLIEICDPRTLREKAAAVALVVGTFRDVLPADYDLESVEDYRILAEEVVAIFDPAQAAGVPIVERYHAAVALGVRGDLRLRGVAPAMVPIAAGGASVGAQAEDPAAPNFDPDAGSLEGPVCLAFSGAFEIGRYPVTVHEYERFVAGRGYIEHDRKFWADKGWAAVEKEQRSAPRDWDRQLRTPNYPVTGVTAFEAEAYCRWLMEQADDGWCYRLPTADEWEFATRRNDPAYRAFSWGNEPKDVSNVFGFNQVVPVGLFVEDRSASGLCDLSGNVSEWTLDDAGAIRESGVRLAARRATDSQSHGARVIKGGNYRNARRSNRTAALSGKQDTLAYNNIGFRVLRRPKPVKIKEELPTLEYACSLADWFAFYEHRFQVQGATRTSLLDDFDPALGEKMESFLAGLFPSLSRGRIVRPCRLGDQPKKFAHDLTYQDSRMKVSCEKQFGAGASTEIVSAEVDRRLATVACLLASPRGGSALWRDLNDNDLDAIVFAVLRHFEPGRDAELHSAGLAANRMAMAALPDRETLHGWDLAKVIKFQVYAGVRLLKSTEHELTKQFGDVTHFRDHGLAKFRDRLAGGGMLLFLFDDNGELVWDLALIELLLDEYHGLKIVGVVSTEVVGNNATQATLERCLGDSRFTHLTTAHRHRFEIHQERSVRSCIDPACASSEFQRLWKMADAIYVKGVHGFETLQELPKPAFYAFVAYSSDSVKCSGFERDTALFVAVPERFKSFEYGNQARTLRHQLDRLGHW